MITLPDEGLEKEQVVSVGRNPAPATEMREPIRPLREVKEITGADLTIINAAFPAYNNSTVTKSTVAMTLK